MAENGNQRVDSGEEDDYASCNKCGFPCFDRYPQCPNCGLKDFRNTITKEK